MIGGADCGPVNSLAQLSKRVGGDRGVAGGSQWDRQQNFNPSSSSQSSFRSRPSNSNPGPFGEEEFFRNQQQHQQQQQAAASNVFDFSKLQGSLPFAPAIGPQGAHLDSIPHMNQQFNNHLHMEAAFRPTMNQSPAQQQQQPAPSGWAAAFLNKNQVGSASQEHSPQRMESPSMNQSNMMNRGMGLGGMGIMGGGSMNHQMGMMNQNTGSMYSHHSPAMGMDVEMQGTGLREDSRMHQKGESQVRAGEGRLSWE